jgi:WD repeat-containing protein 26
VTASLFRQAVLGGDVTNALELLNKLEQELLSSGDAHRIPRSVQQKRIEYARYLLFCNMFMMLVESGDTAGALKCLREDIQPLESMLERRHHAEDEATTSSRDMVVEIEVEDSVLESYVTKHSLSRLASMLMNCAPPHPCPPKRSRDVDVDVQRQEELLHDLQTLLSPDVLIPDNRLEKLVEQALSAQVKSCVHHNERYVQLSLMEDYTAGPESLPTVPYHTLTLHTDEVWVVQFSPDGKWLVTASKDGNAILWNVENSRTIQFSRVLYSGRAPINIGVFSPSSKEILIGSSDGRISVFKVLNGEKVVELQSAGHEGISAAMWAHSDSRIALVSNKEVRLIDIGPGHGLNGHIVYKYRLHQHSYDSVMSSDGGTFVSVGQDRMIRYTRFSDSKVVTRGPEPSAVTCLSRSADGAYLASNLANGSIHIWALGDLEGGSSIDSTLESPESPSNQDPLDMLPKEPLFVLKGLHLPEPGRFVIRSAFGGAGDAFVGTGSESSLMHIWHRESQTLLASVEGHTATVNAVAWNPMNDHMLASASDDHKVIVWLSQKLLSRPA